MKIETLAGGYDKNLMYVVACEATGAGLIVDASLDADAILAAAKRLGARPTVLALTHTHGDHVVSVKPLLERLPELQLWAFGDVARARAPADRYRALADGDRHTVGQLDVEVIHTPGHSPDGVCFRVGEALFTGDTLFVGRTGRTRAAGADTRQLYRSIGTLAGLPDALQIYPGHDYGPTPTATLGEQRRDNPFLQAVDEDDFVRIMAEYEASR